MKPIQNSWGRFSFAGLACWLLISPAICSAQSVPVRSRVKANPPAARKADAKPERPAWKDIEKNIHAALAKIKDYKPGDVITREEAAPLFTALKKSGWEVPKEKELSGRLLPSSDEMVRQLRGKQGRKFMREIGTVPGGYDRLDKLRKLPRGSQRMREFIESPEGHKLIEYMATTPGGKHMGRELSSKKHGDFNAPTKRIYTEQQLLTELKALYQAESATVSKRSSD